LTKKFKIIICLRATALKLLFIPLSFLSISWYVFIIDYESQINSRIRNCDISAPFNSVSSLITEKRICYRCPRWLSCRSRKCCRTTRPVCFPRNFQRKHGHYLTSCLYENYNGWMRKRMYSRCIHLTRIHEQSCVSNCGIRTRYARFRENALSFNFDLCKKTSSEKLFFLHSRVYFRFFFFTLILTSNAVHKFRLKFYRECRCARTD